MPISFEQAQPLDIMQQAATDKQRFEQAEKDRAFALQRSQAQAAVNHQRVQERLAAQAQSQNAYEFAASRQPSGRDYFQAQQQQQASQEHYAQQEASRERALTQSEFVRMQSLQRQIDVVRQFQANGQFTPEEAAEATSQLNGFHGPLYMRNQAAQTQAAEMRVQEQMQENARMTVMRGTDRNAAAQMAASGTIDGALMGPEYAGRRYQVNQHGSLDPIATNEAPPTPEQVNAERRNYGGATVSDVQRIVRDRFRASGEFQGIGAGELSNAGVEELVGRDRFKDEVDQELMSRAATGSPQQQEAVLQHGLQLSGRIHDRMRLEETAATANTADASLRQDWMGDETKRAAHHALLLQREMQGVRALLGIIDPNASRQPGTAPGATPQPGGEFLDPVNFPTPVAFQQAARGLPAMPSLPVNATARQQANHAAIRIARAGEAQGREGGEAEANALESIRGRVSAHLNAGNNRPWYENLVASEFAGSTMDAGRMNDILQRAIGANGGLTPQERMAYQQIYQRISDRGDVPAETLARMRLPGDQPRVLVSADRVAELRDITTEAVRVPLGPLGNQEARSALRGINNLLNMVKEAGRGLMPWEVSAYNNLLLQLNRHREQGFGRLHDQLRLVRQ